MVPLGWALRSAGHDVCVATLPNLTDEVVGSGLPALPVGERVDVTALLREAQDEPEGGNQVAGARLRGLVRWNARLSALLIDGLLGVVRARPPDLIVHEPMDLAGPLLAGLLGVPAVRHPFGPPMRDSVTAGMRRAGAALQVRYGLPGPPAEPAVVLDPWPASLDGGVPPSPRRQPMRYTPYGGPGPIPDWVREPPAGKRVLVAGSIDSGDTGRTTQLLAAAAALAGPDVEVLAPLPASHLAIVNQAGLAGVQPLAWLPLHHAAGGCAAVLHGGDPATALTFLAAGVPQVVIAEKPDEARLAAALAAGGAGRGVPAGALPDDVAHAVRDVLADPAFAKAAGDLADEVRAMPTPHALVPVIEALVG